MASAKEIRRLAKKTLGISKLRPGQLRAIEAVLGGRDTLAVMSTGYGKSAIYQLAGELLDGPTIVVSPLIALQRDQVEAMEESGASEAAELNSTVSETKREELMESLRSGEREFVLLAPEQLAKDEVLEELRAAKPSLRLSTRLTASASGGTTSAPTTCASAPSPISSAAPPCWR